MECQGQFWRPLVSYAGKDGTKCLVSRRGDRVGVTVAHSVVDSLFDRSPIDALNTVAGPDPRTSSIRGAADIRAGADLWAEWRFGSAVMAAPARSPPATLIRRLRRRGRHPIRDRLARSMDECGGIMPGEMIQSGRSGARLALVLLGVFAARAMSAQNPTATANEKSTRAGTHAFNPAAAQVIQPGQLATVAPQPPAELKVVLKGPDQNPIHVNDPLTFTLSLDPPSSSPLRVMYLFRWDNDPPGDFSEQSTATHRFPTAGPHTVAGMAVINGDSKIASNTVTVEVGEPAPVPQPPAPAPQPPSTSTFPPVTSTPPDTRVEPPRPVRPRGGIDVGGTNIPTWAIVLAAVAAILILIRALIPRPPERPEPAAAPPILFHRGLRGPTEHTIEHPEKILNGLSVRVRAGIRSEVSVKGEPDA